VGCWRELTEVERSELFGLIARESARAASAPVLPVVEEAAGQALQPPTVGNR
jgi:hypothetical protein